MCNSPMGQHEYQFLLLDGELDHRQHAGSNYKALHTIYKIHTAHNTIQFNTEYSLTFLQ